MTLTRIERLLTMYEKGIITDHQLVDDIVQELARIDDDLVDAIQSIPGHIQQTIKERSKQLPADDDLIGWSGLLTFCCGVETQEARMNPPTEEERKRKQQEDNEQSRLAWAKVRRHGMG